LAKTRKAKGYNAEIVFDLFGTINLCKCKCAGNKNYGKLTVTGNVTFAAGSLFHNYCALITDDNLTK
jgi:hypothetical protein